MFLEHKLSFGTVPLHILRSATRHALGMRFAISARDRRIADLVRVLDQDEQPAAETWRLVSAAAERLGERRPSYGHVRRLVRVERALRLLRRERREVLAAAGVRLAAGGVPSVPRLIDKLGELRDREELVFQEHKPP